MKPEKKSEQEDMIWTWVSAAPTIGGHEEHCRKFGFVNIGSHIYHRRDLSDLGEPYLSAVKEALKVRAEIKGKSNEK